MKDNLSQEIHGNMIFSVYTHRRYKRDTMPKKPKMILSCKNKSNGD